MYPEKRAATLETMARAATTQATIDQPVGTTRRDHLATAVFGTWMIAGLFLDGWAHTHDKPETFFSPWHGVLYSGFAAGMAFAVVEQRRRRRHAGSAAVEPLTLLGVALFLAGAVTDMVWHEVFGIEVDLEALLSPTHLLLMVGGLLMLSGPIRWGLSERGAAITQLRNFLPAAVTLTLATALVSFFLMFLSAFIPHDGFGLPREATELQQVHGVASVLVTNLLLLAPMLLVLRTLVPPAGTFTILFGGVALAMAGLEAFEFLPLAIPALVGGAVAEIATARIRSGAGGSKEIRVMAALVPLALWTSWFAVYAFVYDLHWPVELWTGSIVLAVLSGVGLGFLAFPPAPRSAP
jgi:hypothetical protein